MSAIQQKIIALVGPTAVGKTALSLQLARELDAEIVSADSRQVYRGLDCGTAKITKEEMQDIPHHMLDVIDPSQVYTVADYQRDALTCIDDIFSRGKNCLVVGGSGLYVDSILYEQNFPKVLPDTKMRELRAEKSSAEIFEELQMKDPRRANTIDSENKIRLIRALEIVDEMGAVPETPFKMTPRFVEQKIISLYRNPEDLKERIHQRNVSRILETSHLVDEVQGLLDSGVTRERLYSFGLEYRYTLSVLFENMSREQLVEILDLRTCQFVKRQMTWWKKNPDIIWVHAEDREKVLTLLGGR